MSSSFRPAAFVLAALLAPAASAADPTDPAELFPPGTLAYAEIHDPASVGPQIAAALKGSALEDSIAFIHNRRDKTKEPRDLMAKDQLAILGLLASPEMAAEFKRFRGVAAGVTGFTEQGEAELAVAVLTGESSAAGLTARAFLTMTSVRKVGAIGDVPVYQFRQPAFAYDPNGQQILQNDKPPTEGAHEATFAYLPGLFIAGTSKAAVAEVVTRYQGKAKGSLEATPAFKEAAAAHRQPGLFFFANFAEFCAKSDEARKKVEVGAEMEPASLGWFKLLVNAKAVRYVAGCAKFRDGGLAITISGAFDPNQKSPLLDFLGGPGVKLDLLRHAPAPATVAFALSLPEKNRSAAIIGFLDALAKASGELGRTPGEIVKELEAKYKVALAENLIGKARAATVVLPVKQDLPKGAIALPILVLHTESADVAAAWEEFLPKLIGDLAGAAPPQASTETIDGMKVTSLPAGNLPWKAAVHYARKDGVFAIGLDRKLVVAAANGDAGNASGAAVPAGEPPVLIGSLGLGGLVRVLTEAKPLEGPVVPRGPATPAKPQPGFGGRGFSEEIPSLPDGQNLPEKQRKGEAQAMDAVFKALDGLSPTALSVRRIGNELRIELFQPKVQGGGLAPLVNAGIGWFDQVLNRTPNPNGYYGPRYGRFR